MWLFRIIFNKRLRDRELIIRKKYLLSNDFLLEEIEKLESIIDEIKLKDIMEDFYLATLKKMNLKDTKFCIKIINKTISYLWISRKDVEKSQDFCRQARKIISKLIHESPKLKQRDSFKSNNKASIFYYENEETTNIDKADFSNVFKKLPLRTF